MQLIKVIWSRFQDYRTAKRAEREVIHVTVDPRWDYQERFL